jgi:hypothetical protein
MSKHAYTEPQGSPTPEDRRMTEDKKVVPITPLQPVRPATVQAHSERSAFDSAKFEQMWTMAERMANSTLVPLTLRTRLGEDGKPVPLELGQIVANLAKVVNQADTWGMNPFNLLDEVSIATDKDGESHMVYGGKVIMAALEAKGVILDYEFAGPEGTLLRTVKATGKRGDGKEVFVKGLAQSWFTSKWQMDMLDKMLTFRAAREWARLYKPAVMLGVYAADEFEAAPTKPAAPKIAEPKALPTRRGTAVPHTSGPGDVPAREGAAGPAAPPASQAPEREHSVSRETVGPKARTQVIHKDAKPTSAPKPVGGKKAKPPANDDEERIWLAGFKKEVEEVSGRAHLERVIQRREKVMRHLSPAGDAEAKRLINDALAKHPDQ